MYSIGAVARMLGVEPATLRAWEDRYGVVVAARSKGAQRLYSRDQVDQLRTVVHSMEEGATAAEAHRLLGERLGSPTAADAFGGGTVVLVLLAEPERFSAELIEYFLRTEGYDLRLASTAGDAERLLDAHGPQLSIVDLVMPGAIELCHRIALTGTAPVLAVSALALVDEAMSAGASAFLHKPLEQLQFVSTVRDLLGSSALTRAAPARLS